MIGGGGGGRGGGGKGEAGGGLAGGGGPVVDLEERKSDGPGAPEEGGVARGGGGEEEEGVRRDESSVHHDRVDLFHGRDAPVVSVDTKKELVGAFANGGREWQPRGDPVQVRVHDFIDPTLGKAIPYGVYDLAQNTGWVSVGIDHDTPAFAVESIARWWRYMGKTTYPDARELLITADAGGSNSARARLWKVELQRFADRTGLTISVSHFPPGTSKWNKIEHRLFCHITENWRGRPLTDHETIVQLMGSVPTASGLTVKAKLDTRIYPLGVKVPNADMDNLLLTRAAFHGELNDTIHPRAELTQ